MVKVMYNDQLVYKVVIWVFCGVILWKEKEALTYCSTSSTQHYHSNKITTITLRLIVAHILWFDVLIWLAVVPTLAAMSVSCVSSSQLLLIWYNARSIPILIMFSTDNTSPISCISQLYQCEVHFIKWQKYENMKVQ